MEETTNNDLKKFNFGAFIFTWIWGIFNGSFKETCLVLILFIISRIMHIFLLVDLVIFGYAIYCGIKGNEWAYQNKQWESLERFTKVQRYWAVGGAVYLLGVIAIIASLIFIAVNIFIKAPEVTAGNIISTEIVRVINKHDFKSGENVADFFTDPERQDRYEIKHKAEKYGTNGIKYDLPTSNQSFVFTFQKKDDCNLSDKNCYVEFYNLEEGNPVRKFVQYFDESGKTKLERD